jgi:hypothetical protein
MLSPGVTLTLGKQGFEIVNPQLKIYVDYYDYK